MKTVLIFKDALLPVSETFIQSQVAELRRFNAKYTGLKRVNPTLDIPADTVVFVPPAGKIVTQCLVEWYKHTGFGPHFHREISALQPDIVHAHFAPSGACAATIAERMNIPLIVTLHGYDITTKSNYRKRYAKLWEKADLFLCVSEFIKLKALEAGFPANKLRVHYIGVDCSKFVPKFTDREEGLVLFVGRLVEKKGCIYLLRAMREVRGIFPKAHLVVIGDGHLRAGLEREASGLSCRFLGSQSQAVVRKYMEKAAVLCVPSVTAQNGDSEGLPIVILEALACGAPVISTYHAGIPEAILDGQTGLLSDERNPVKLAENLLRFLQDDSFSLVCARHGVTFVQQRFDLKRQTVKLEDIYDEVLRGKW